MLSSVQQREYVERAATSLTPAALDVLGYIMRQRLRMQQDIPFFEIVRNVPARSAVIAAALEECVARGWLSVSQSPGGTSYSVEEAPDARAVVWH